MFGARPKTVSKNVQLSRSSSNERSSASQVKSNTPGSASKSRSSATPPRRLASTPTRGDAKNLNFSSNASCVSPISTSDNAGSQDKNTGTRPKLLKSLGTQRPIGKTDKPVLKAGPSKDAVKAVPKKAPTKDQPVDLRAMYMVYQQYVYFNYLMKQKTEEALAQGEKELLQLWAMVQEAKAAAEEMEAREHLVRRYLELTEANEKLGPIVTDINSSLEVVRDNYQELTNNLDSLRHQLPLENFCDMTSGEIGEITTVLENTNMQTEAAAVPYAADYEAAAKYTRIISQNTERCLTLLQKCQELSAVGKDKLGQQLAAEIEDQMTQLKLSDVDV